MRPYTPEERRAIRKTGLIPQAYTIYDYLMQGHRIDRVRALTLFDCQNLTARIKELRDAGIQLDVDYVRYNKHSRKYYVQRVAEYYINAQDRDCNRLNIPDSVHRPY